MSLTLPISHFVRSSISLFIYLSVCVTFYGSISLLICLTLCRSIYLFAHISIRVSLTLYISPLSLSLGSSLSVLYLSYLFLCPCMSLLIYLRPSISISIYISVHLIFLCNYLYVYLFIYLTVHLYLSINLCPSISVHLSRSIYLNIHLYFCPSYLSVQLSICPSIYLFIYLSDRKNNLVIKPLAIVKIRAQFYQSYTSVCINVHIRIECLSLASLSNHVCDWCSTLEKAVD
jgi:hypothetical protein